eukprot:SM000176S03152  [mRNA]  locus=s176:240953:242782:- [translate_table: standard]
MAGFFGQFGTITRLRLSRSKKTGKSKHYAFIEFESPDVAAIVADCMHNYLLFGAILKVKLLPSDKIHPTTWIGANKTFKKIPWQQMARERHNRERSFHEQQEVLTRLAKKDKRREERLKAAGIQYSFEGFRTLCPSAPVHIKFDRDDEHAVEDKAVKVKRKRRPEDK